MGKHFAFLIFLFGINSCQSTTASQEPILTGADQMDQYLPLLSDQRVGLFVNHTSLVGQTHLTDTLISRGINITKVYTPEHGFKGNQPDGELIKNEVAAAPFELVSIYGKSKKPTDEQMDGIDLLVIDIQDVGARFYTYASSMTYLMDGCARLNLPVMILDRPNPNGSYVDGPVMRPEHTSFIGLHPIPIVHGLTLGELARMINGERWLEGGEPCELQVIPVSNWDHSVPYSLPVRPSPNLPNDLSIALYPSLALFESTVVSVGRGTNLQFQIIGHPQYPETTFSFTPQPNEGSKYPPLEGQKCYGINLSDQSPQYEFTLKYLIHFYEALKDKTEKPFFSQYFARHAGNDQLQEQIESGMSEEEIRQTWQSELQDYLSMRKKYLLYAD